VDNDGAVLVSAPALVRLRELRATGVRILALRALLTFPGTGGVPARSATCSFAGCRSFARAVLIRQLISSPLEPPGYSLRSEDQQR